MLGADCLMRCGKGLNASIWAWACGADWRTDACHVQAHLHAAHAATLKDIL